MDEPPGSFEEYVELARKRGKVAAFRLGVGSGDAAAVLMSAETVENGGILFLFTEASDEREEATYIVMDVDGLVELFAELPMP